MTIFHRLKNCSRKIINKINVHDRDIQSLVIGHLNPLMHNVPEWSDAL